MKFEPGTKVAIVRNYGFDSTTFTADEVLKVHTNGNFTLKSDPKQQWRPYSYGASRTGRSAFDRDNVVVWNAELDARIAAQTASRARRFKLADVKKKINDIDYRCDNDALINALAEALATHSTKQD